jgi:predicted regulator of Ras-like GTPase activity (Roadblock/LC7/MglB family)
MPRSEIRESVTPVEATLSMGEGIEAQLEQILQQLRRKTRGLRGSVIADSNGLTVASDTRNGVNASVLAAMSTLIAQSASGVFENISMPGPEFILMEGPESNVVVMHIPAGDVTLLSLFEKATNIGVMKIEMGRAAVAIANSLGFAPENRSTNISELFVMTDGGLLIRHYSDTLRTDVDRDILSGMLVAVQQFVQQTLAAKSGTLNELRYGQHHVYFFTATHTIAAVVAKDPDPDTLKYQVMDALQDFEDRYGRVLESWNGDTAAFPGIDDCFEKVLKG